MRALPLLSFLCLIKLTSVQAFHTALTDGCEQVATYSTKAKEAPTYAILHCPDTAWAKVKTDGRWVADGHS